MFLHVKDSYVKKTAKQMENKLRTKGVKEGNTILNTKGESPNKEGERIIGLKKKAAAEPVVHFRLISARSMFGRSLTSHQVPTRPLPQRQH